MTDLEITRLKHRQAAAAYRARVHSQTATETITWHPIPGPEMPDDGITVLLQFSEGPASEPVWPGYLDSIEGWTDVSGASLGDTPIAWSHFPIGISPHRYQLMLHAQHTGRPGRPSNSK